MAAGSKTATVYFVDGHPPHVVMNAGAIRIEGAGDDLLIVYEGDSGSAHTFVLRHVLSWSVQQADE